MSNDESNSESTYHLKWVPWNSGKIPIVMQSINGPCPLIAIMNVLLLREKVKLPPMLEQITATQLLTYLSECIMDSVPDEIRNDETAMLNLEQNMNDAIEILPKLNTGLDVNIRFTGITDFEYTPECIIFDLLRIPLYHGWLCDSDFTELKEAIGNQSYNQLVDTIITNKNSSDPDVSAKVLLAEDFLEGTASQLTLHGLNELRRQIKDNEIGILFRNNHFLTLFKRDNEIYTLVTDHGYLTEDNVIWEILDNIEGAGRFFDSNFQALDMTNKQVSEFQAIDQRQKQVESDYLMALYLKEEDKLDAQRSQVAIVDQIHEQDDDFELAKRLQEEEDRLYRSSQGQQTEVSSPSDWNPTGVFTESTHAIPAVEAESSRINHPTSNDFPPLSAATTTSPYQQPPTSTNAPTAEPQPATSTTSKQLPDDKAQEPSLPQQPQPISIRSTQPTPATNTITTNNSESRPQPLQLNQSSNRQPMPSPAPPLQQPTTSTSTSDNSNSNFLHRRPRCERKDSKDTNCIVI